ncbi:MAG: DUF1801 domain-containing protein [Anaerolineaceae bacterium]|nr:DUF1801 domain-containing protein [Anaerolineaceae bacterium]
MDASKKQITTIDDYIAMFPADVQAVLEQLRQTIRQVAPDAKEAISYQIPTFKLNGNLVYFAAFKNHYGFYPASSSIAAFETDLAPYTTSKGAIQFPKDRPIPFDLITRIVEFRVQENLAKGKKKKA